VKLQDLDRANRLLKDLNEINRSLLLVYTATITTKVEPYVAIDTCAQAAVRAALVDHFRNVKAGIEQKLQALGVEVEG
jgi:hypothetical protein